MTESYPFPWRFDPARYPEIYLMRQVTEAQVQRDVLALLHSYNVDAVPIDAGGRRQRGLMMAAAKKIGVALAGLQNVKTGSAIPAGFADLEATLAPEGRSLYIEVKAPEWIDVTKKTIREAGKPSEEQLQFLLAKHRRGAIVLVAWSADDVIDRIQRPLLEVNRKAVR